METGVIWSVKTLVDALAAGDEINLNSRSTRADKPELLQYQCGCGRFVFPEQLVDVRHIDAIDLDFACDGCRSYWQRNRVQLDDLGPVQDKGDWLKRWSVLHDAPAQVQDNIGKIITK